MSLNGSEAGGGYFTLLGSFASSRPGNSMELTQRGKERKDHMNRLIQLKAKLQCFANALLGQTKGNTLIEISKLICCALLLTLALRSGPACEGFQWPGTGGSPTPGGVPQARTVQFFNCNHMSGPTEPPSGRAYNVYSQVDGGAWVGRGGLNPQPGEWTDCHDAAHQGSSLTLDLFATQQGKWEFRLIKLPLSGEPDCDSSSPPDDPNAQNPCSELSPYFFQTVDEAAPVTIDVTE